MSRELSFLHQIRFCCYIEIVSSFYFLPVQLQQKGFPVIQPHASDLSAAQRALASKSEAEFDKTLVTRFVGGDENAFIEIMSRYRAKVFTVAFSLLHNHADTEEITQDTFIRAYRGLSKFRGDSSLATWLYRIAVNLARNRYWFFFRRRRHATVSLETPVGEDGTATFQDMIVSDDPSPSKLAAMSEFDTVISECMKSLSSNHREVMSMRLERHMDYNEMAATLCLDVGTVKSRLARARLCLLAKLASVCPELAYREDVIKIISGDNYQGTIRVA